VTAASENPPVLKFLASIVLGAVLAFSPQMSVAQTPAGATPTHHLQTHRPTGSHRSQMRHRSNLHKERARAGAEHVRTMRQQ
jgi:hypothetical protein